ncbi:MAG: LLM class flavin-dependent oxidoreductase, partial [Cytophagaceae bacterium]
MIPFSVLDLSPIVEGNTATQALRNTLNLAQHAEQLGYNRYWLAEHHNMPGIASAATSVVIGYVAGGTSTIRVGSGGIMLPNHSPLIIAEQFGTLESLYPGRIDLGLGRAPGSDQATSQALRRSMNGPDTFPQDVVELQQYFQPNDTNQFVQAIPGTGLDIPIWILGSSLFGAQLAAMLGLPYAFASHFAPAELLRALQVYRTHFKPSEHLKAPYAMVAANVIAADTDQEAQRLFTSVQQQFLYIRRGKARQMQP